MKIAISRVENAFEGKSFGEVGPYEQVIGRIFGEADPAHPLNAGIVNLDKAPQNAAGRVEYWSDFAMLRPVDPRKANRRLLYDVLNRGNKLVLASINDGPRINDLGSATTAGRGFLMRRGYTILWSGWQGDVPAGEGRMLVGFPVATENGAPIVALNRDEFIFGDLKSPAIAPLSYPANSLDKGEATLTVRRNNRDSRVMVAPDRWHYLSATKIEISLPGDYDAGAIYEFIYPARDPIVMGLGFAAMRDAVAFMRYDAADDSGAPNPLKSYGLEIEHAIAFGSSQSGRFLRDFLWQGFNEDLKGRRVFDGMLVNVAGSRKTFTNFAFGQPGRFSKQHEDHLTPGDQFPFSYANRTDPVSGKSGGILDRCERSGTCPKIMQTDTSAEFWQGRSSLIVTDEKGEKDIALPDNVRMYLFSSTQHGGPIATPVPFRQFNPNPVNYAPVLRALVVAMDEWVSFETPPPHSRFPAIADGTLSAPTPQEQMGFPAIPGVTYTGRVNEICIVDYSSQPPEQIQKQKYTVLVPKVDRDGNEIAGIRLPDVAVPLGTHTGWNPRRDGFAQGESSFAGSFFPFAATANERRGNGDPRLSIEERYPSHGDYARAVADAAAKLEAERLLLAEDVQSYVDAAALRKKSWPKP